MVVPRRVLGPARLRVRGTGPIRASGVDVEEDVFVVEGLAVGGRVLPSPRRRVPRLAVVLRRPRGPALLGVRVARLVVVPRRLLGPARLRVRGAGLVRPPDVDVQEDLLVVETLPVGGRLVRSLRRRFVVVRGRGLDAITVVAVVEEDEGDGVLRRLLVLAGDVRPRGFRRLVLGPSERGPARVAFPA